MKKVCLNTTCTNIPADLYTPVGIYLRMRDKFRDTILLESTEANAGENSHSIICINAIAGIEIVDTLRGEYKYPNQHTEEFLIKQTDNVSTLLNQYMDGYEVDKPLVDEATKAQGLFGYISYEAVQFFDSIQLSKPSLPVTTQSTTSNNIPLIRYRLYQYVIIFNHYKDEILLCENNIAGIESRLQQVQNIMQSKDVPQYPFALKELEEKDITDAQFLQNVEKGIAACKRGDVFQIVLSRSYTQGYTGDDFNVYRKLRSINPGPYLFYFDYGDYVLMGSSPESKLQINNGKATIHPIAGTFKRTNHASIDEALAADLQNDKKENAEHTMLVDLARNDLSKVCTNVKVIQYKHIQYYSHLIHMVSKVEGEILAIQNPFAILAAVFPAGTLSGAPKYKAMQLINDIEANNRAYYGGAIGYMGFNKTCNHAIMIRTFLSKNNKLSYRAGAGIVAASIAQQELEEVNHKLAALRSALQAAHTTMKV